MPDREVRLEHFFDAPCEAVFAAWTDPDKVAIWWAPEGLTIPRESVVVEPRVGGRFELDMVDPSGQTAPLRAEFVEFEPPVLIVLRVEPMPEAGMGETVLRAEFEAEGSGTRLRVADGPLPEELYENASAGWDSVISNLHALLAD
jgi:uncharacterized protein YndB with AHSA1/START domain